MEKKKWSLGDKLTAGGVFLAAVAIIVGLLTPEVRQFVHLEKPPEVAPAATSQTSLQPTPQTQSSEPLTKEPPKQAAKGTQYITKNSVAGTSNSQVTQTSTGLNSPNVSAPNGIAIVGNEGTITNPTVNNYGPPPVQLMWSVSDAPAEAKAGEFAKALTVKSNALYAPVYLAITCDTEIEQLSPIGVSMDVHTGYFNGDKKQGFLRMGNPPVMPESPLLIIITSKTPLTVLSVAMVKDKQP